MIADLDDTLPTSDRERVVEALFSRSIALKQKLMTGYASTVVRMADICVQAVAGGGKLLFCGNGGSASDAQHLAAELLVRLRPNVNRHGIAAIALSMDPSSMTACGNDYSYDVFYERMLRALGRPGDVLIAITTSGKSANVLGAMRAAREMGIITLGLLGGDGGPALAESDYALVVPATETGRIQECHIMIGHALMEQIEDALLANGTIGRI